MGSDQVKESLEVVKKFRNIENEKYKSTQDAVKNVQERVDAETEAVKKTPFDIRQDMLASADKTFEKAEKTKSDADKVPNENAGKHTKETIEGTRERLIAPKREKLKKFTSLENENLQRERIYEFDSTPLFATQRLVTGLENVFEPTTSSRVVPMIISSLKKVLK